MIKIGGLYSFLATEGCAEFWNEVSNKKGVSLSQDTFQIVLCLFCSIHHQHHHGVLRKIHERREEKSQTDGENR